MGRVDIAALVVTATLTGCSAGSKPEITENTEQPPWQTFQIDALKQQRQTQGVGFLEFLDEPAVSMGLYHLAAGAVDGQDAHGLDEVYYVVNGAATIAIEGVDHPVEAGSSVFVRANADHRFHSITEDLDVLVVFSKSTPNSADPAGLAFTLGDVLTPRDANQNVWNEFLGTTTMSLGMYMLPQSVGGDGTLTHDFAEVNIVVDGAARFAVGDDTIDIAAGTIMYVEQGAGHRFHTLSGDVDVLIWWER